MWLKRNAVAAERHGPTRSVAAVIVLIVPGLPRPMPNRKPPVLSRLSRLMPISRASVRLTSAIRTWSMTCCGVAVRRRLTTWVPSPTKAWTSRSASAASAGWATVPVSSTMPFIGVAWMSASGMARSSICADRAEILADADVGRIDDPAGPVGRVDAWCCRRPCRRCRSGWASVDVDVGDVVVGDEHARSRPR